LLNGVFSSSNFNARYNHQSSSLVPVSSPSVISSRGMVPLTFSILPFSEISDSANMFFLYFNYRYFTPKVVGVVSFVLINMIGLVIIAQCVYTIRCDVSGLTEMVNDPTLGWQSPRFGNTVTITRTFSTSGICLKNFCL
jgi:hypothetical protein